MLMIAIVSTYIMIDTINKLNRFADGCEDTHQLLDKLIEQKAIISAYLARLVINHL